MRSFKISRQITNRQSDSIAKYLSDISKIPMLTIQEEVSLAKKIKEGDQLALKKLVSANLRFVVSVAKQYHNNNIPLGDLINEGNIGLIKAAERFDETRGFKFISYAIWWIRQSIMQAIANQSRTISLSVNQFAVLNKLNRTIADWEQKKEYEPSIAELANEMEVSELVIEQAMCSRNKEMSLNAAMDDSADFCLLDVLNDETDYSDKFMYNESLKEEVKRIIKQLPSNMAIVLTLYYGLDKAGPLPLEEISQILGLTKERVRQIKEKALMKICQMETMKNTLRNYL